MDFVLDIYSWVGSVLGVLAAIEVWMLVGRKLFKLEKHITINRFESINKGVLFLSLILGALFFVVMICQLRSQPVIEQYVFYNRILGKYYWAYIIMLSGKLVFPQLYWFKTLRGNLYVTFVVAVLINLDIGVWIERFIILASS